LSVSLEEGSGLQSEKNLQSFQKGVNDRLGSNLLHMSFMVRTNHLFGKLSKQENYYYLSGLLIGIGRQWPAQFKILDRLIRV
jgi:2-dehydro-3-deoxygalactonokinase